MNKAIIMRYPVLITFLLLLFTNVAANPLEKVRLQLKWFSSFQFAGYYMALEKGYYAQSGLEVEIIERDPTKNNILQVADGDVEYGVADSAVLLYRAQGKPLKILASIFQHSPLVFIARKDSGIFSPLEMKGKVISYQQGIDDAPFLAMLKEANLNMADYRYAPLDFTNGAFLRGEVDVMSAYLSDQPFTMKEKGVEINIINPLNYGIDFYGDNLITNQQELDQHPERAKAFLKASLQGWKYALSNKEETTLILRTKYHAKSSIEHLTYEAEVTEKMMIPEMVEIGYTSIERFYRIADIYQRIGKIDKLQAQKALENLIYVPVENKHNYLRYLQISLGLVLLFGFATVSLLLASRRLKRLVKERTQYLSEVLDFNKTILLNSPLPMLVYTASGECIMVNDAYAKLVGSTRESLLIQNFNNIAEWRQTGLLDNCLTALEQSTQRYCEINTTTSLGSELWLECRILPIHLNGKSHLLMQYVDLTERKRLEEELRHIAFHDYLTTLPNRRLLLDRLQQALYNSKRQNSHVAVLFIDLDKFKELNDVHGHDVGDQLLIEVTNRLRREVRDIDTVARLGGDEFVVLLENLDADLNNATNQVSFVVEKIRSALSVEYVFGKIRHHGSASIGIKLFIGDEITSDQLLKAADIAMYEAKKGGIK